MIKTNKKHQHFPPEKTPFLNLMPPCFGKYRICPGLWNLSEVQGQLYPDRFCTYTGVGASELLRTVFSNHVFYIPIRDFSRPQSHTITFPRCEKRRGTEAEGHGGENKWRLAKRNDGEMYLLSFGKPPFRWTDFNCATLCLGASRWWTPSKCS